MKAKVRVELIIPADTPSTGGNRVSADRLQRALMRLGIPARLSTMRAVVPHADVYHAFNAVKVGIPLLQRGVAPQQLVVTWTGTDLWQEWVARAAALGPALDGVREQVVFTADARARLLEDAPGWDDRVSVVPPSVDVQMFGPEGDSFPHTSLWVLLAGGIRPVKRSAWAIELMDQLRQATRAPIDLFIAGPVRDEKEGEQVKTLAAERPWVHYVGEVAAEQMPQWYRSADVVLNTSRVEGVSNALMEAMSAGCLVIATDIAGNRALVEDGVTGFLFHDANDLVGTMRALARGERFAGVRANARQYIVRHHSLEAEALAYREIYQRCGRPPSAARGCCP